MKSLTGHCLCVAVEYTINAEPELSFLCQCRQCQKITGSGHSSEFAVSNEAMSISGELSSYEMKSENNNTVSSLFCPICGNPIYKKSTGYPGLYFVHAATLENLELFKPDTPFWHSSHQPWDFVDPTLEVKQNNNHSHKHGP